MAQHNTADRFDTSGLWSNAIEPAGALPGLELTLEVHQRLTQPAG